MSEKLTVPVGFARPRGNGRASRQRVVVLELMASLALALSTLVTATVVTIGYARADMLDAAAIGDDGRIGVALVLGLLFAGMGGLTALMTRGRR